MSKHVLLGAEIGDSAVLYKGVDFWGVAEIILFEGLGIEIEL